jgi:hypothetical protein
MMTMTATATATTIDDDAATTTTTTTTDNGVNSNHNVLKFLLMCRLNSLMAYYAITLMNKP